MGIGRGSFLKLASLALAGLATDPLKAVVINNDTYLNRKLGVLFNKPRNWGFIAVKDFGRLKSRQIVGSGLDMTSDEIWRNLGEPVCVATKYYKELPEFKGVFSPTITFNVTPKDDLKEAGYESFEELIELSNYGTGQILKDFHVIKTFEPYYICGCKFHEIDAEYLFEHVEIDKPLRVELKTFKAEHNGFYYDFNCHQSEAQRQTAKEEFELFRNSIKLL